MHPPLILASTSPYRQELLRRLGVAFEAHPHTFDESSLKRLGWSADEVAVRLAEAKARSLQAAFPGRWILGSDQVAELDGEILDKPETEARAIQQLQRLQGRTHRLITALCLLSPQGEARRELDLHLMRMRPLSDDQITRYIQRDQPLDCCGSYKIESLGIALFDGIDGADFTAIMGLPLIALTHMLEGSAYAPLTPPGP